MNTRRGTINRNNQEVMGTAGKKSNHPTQRTYHMRCNLCRGHYVSNGCDIFHRKCPTCQSGKQGVDL